MQLRSEQCEENLWQMHSSIQQCWKSFFATTKPIRYTRVKVDFPQKNRWFCGHQKRSFMLQATTQQTLGCPSTSRLRDMSVVLQHMWSKRAEVMKMKSWRLEDVVCFDQSSNIHEDPEVWTTSHVSTFKTDQRGSYSSQIHLRFLFCKYISKTEPRHKIAGSPTQIRHDLLLQINALDPAILCFHSYPKGWNTIHTTKKLGTNLARKNQVNISPNCWRSQNLLEMGISRMTSVFLRWFQILNRSTWLVVLTITCCVELQSHWIFSGSNFWIFEL